MRLAKSRPQLRVFDVQGTLRLERQPTLYKSRLQTPDSVFLLISIPQCVEARSTPTTPTLPPTRMIYADSTYIGTPALTVWPGEIALGTTGAGTPKQPERAAGVVATVYGILCMCLCTCPVRTADPSPAMPYHSVHPPPFPSTAGMVAGWGWASHGASRPTVARDHDRTSHRISFRCEGLSSKSPAACCWRIAYFVLCAVCCVLRAACCSPQRKVRRVMLRFLIGCRPLWHEGPFILPHPDARSSRHSQSSADCYLQMTCPE